MAPQPQLRAAAGTGLPRPSPAPSSRWKLRASSLRLTVDTAPKGISPDWVIYDTKWGFLRDTDKDKAMGAYNAIRVYLWAGMLHPRLQHALRY